MDYSNEIGEIKSVLDYCNKHVKCLKSISYYKGNEKVVEDIVQRLQKALLEYKLLDEGTLKPLASAEKMLRKIVMLLMLNVRHSDFKYKLQEDDYICHFVGLLPTLSRLLCVKIIYDLNLEDCLYEALAYTPIWFAVQFFETAESLLPYIENWYIQMEHVEKLLNAISINVARSERLQWDVVEKQRIWLKFYEFTINILRERWIIDANTFDTSKRRLHYRRCGYMIKHIMQSLLHAFDVFEARENVVAADDKTFYDICKNACLPPLKGRELKTCDLQMAHLKIIKALLDALESNVVQVRVAVYVMWVEVDISSLLTLQRFVSEMAYAVCQRIEANVAFKHNVLKMLKELAKPPKSLAECLKQSTIGEILEKLEGDELELTDKKAYLNELFSRNITFGNDECIQAIGAHVKLFSTENCLSILDYLKKQNDFMIAVAEAENNDTIKVEKDTQVAVKVENESVDAMQLADDDEDDVEDVDAHAELKLLLLKALHNFQTDDILELLIQQNKLFGQDNSIFRQANFQQRSTLFVNKNSTNFDLKNFLILCFEHAQKMWRTLYEASSSDVDAMHTFCCTVKQAKPFSSSYFEQLLEATLNDVEKIQEDCFAEILCIIYFQLYFQEQKEEFIKNIINAKVSFYMNEKNYNAVLPFVKALHLISIHKHSQNPLNFAELTAPVLVMVARILDKSRWDIFSYTVTRCEIVSLGTRLLMNHIKIFLPVSSAKDRKWLKKIVKESFRPSTQYYFHQFLCEQGSDAAAKEFHRFLMPQGFADEDEAQKFLLSYFVRSTKKEAEWLAGRSSELTPHITSMLLMLSEYVKANPKEQCFAAYSHCMANYGNVVRKFLLPQAALKEHDLINLVLDILKILKAAPAHLYEDIFMSFESLIVDIMSAVPDRACENMAKKMTGFMKNMRDCRAKRILKSNIDDMVLNACT